MLAGITLDFDYTSLALLAVVSFVVFMPTLVAAYKKTGNIRTVSLINALTWWTIVGWLFAFFLAARDDD